MNDMGHAMQIMQGDAYKLPFRLTQDGEVITEQMVEDVEIVIGSTIKSYANGKIHYSDGNWLYPLTQEQTFAMCNHPQDVQVRVKFHGGDVMGVPLPPVKLERSTSKEVL